MQKTKTHASECVEMGRLRQFPKPFDGDGDNEKNTKHDRHHLVHRGERMAQPKLSLLQKNLQNANRQYMSVKWKQSTQPRA